MPNRRSRLSSVRVQPLCRGRRTPDRPEWSQRSPRSLRRIGSNRWSPLPERLLSFPLGLFLRHHLSFWMTVRRHSLQPKIFGKHSMDSLHHFVLPSPLQWEMMMVPPMEGSIIGPGVPPQRPRVLCGTRSQLQSDASRRPQEGRSVLLMERSSMERDRSPDCNVKLRGISRPHTPWRLNQRIPN